MVHDKRQIVVPLEVMRGAYDCPLLFAHRVRGLEAERRGGVMDITTKRVLTDFEKIKKSGSVMSITAGMVEYLERINTDTDSEMKAELNRAFFVYLAHRSINRARDKWIWTNNNHFLARLAGYSTAAELETANDSGTVAGIYNGGGRKQRRECQKLRALAARCSVYKIEFAQAERRRGYLFKNSY